MRAGQAGRSAATDAKERIVTAAERLIAERGAQVPLRDIAVAAEQRNNSAVQYHFGSRNGLIEAVVAFRHVPVQARQITLLAEHEDTAADDDVATLLRIFVRPMLEVPYRQGATHYARFLEQVRTHPAVSEESARRGDRGAATRIIVSRLRRAMHGLPDDVRLRRIRSLPTVLFALLSDHERAAEAGAARIDDPRAADELISVLAGMLTAPQAIPR
ncbi:MAG: hypothetical protein ACRDQB_07640 [Thermocrispum sp.]